MGNKRENELDQLDRDLIEQLDVEEMHVLIREAQSEALHRDAMEKTKEKPVRRFPKWLFWFIAVVFLFSTFSFVFQIYSIPAIEFLAASTRLSSDEDVQLYKKSVVTIAAGDSKGTGFSITSDGKILTNYHVIEGNQTLIVDFPDNGIYTAKVVDTYEEIDLALLQVEGENLPFLELSDNPSYMEHDPIIFIGNPLRFHGIVNEGSLIDSVRLSDWDTEVIMMKAPVYRGNSGSPVLDESGHVIGVVFATMKHKEYGKVGLFVPIGTFLGAFKNN